MPKKDDLPYMMGLKLRLYPNWKQEKILWKNLNASRFIYNQLLANSWTDSRIIKNNLISDTQFQKHIGVMARTARQLRRAKNGRLVQLVSLLNDILGLVMMILIVICSPIPKLIIRPLGICFGKYTLPENQSLSEKAVLFSHIRLPIIIRVQP